MNRTVFFKDGTIMSVQQSNRYLKKQIAVKREIDGPIPYRFSGPYTTDEIVACWVEFRVGVFA